MMPHEDVNPYIRRTHYYGPGPGPGLAGTTYERLNPTGAWKIVYPASSGEYPVEPQLYLEHEYTRIMIWLFPIKMKRYRWVHEDQIVFRTEHREELFTCRG